MTPPAAAVRAGVVAIGVMLGGCSFAWDDFDPRQGGGAHGGSGGSAMPLMTGGGGADGGGGGEAGGGGTPLARKHELIVNGDFAAMFDGWTLANNPAGAYDVRATWITVNEVCESESSTNPCARVLYQDLPIPSTVLDAHIAFDFAQELPQGQTLDPENVTRIEKDGYDDSGRGGAQNAFRIDLIDPAAGVFDAPILLEVYAPVDNVGSLGNLVAIDPAPPGLLAILQAHAGGTLRLRIAHVESTFPWPLQIDNLSLMVAGVR